MSTFTTVRDDEARAKLEEHAVLVFRAMPDDVLGMCLLDAVRQSRWDDARFYARVLKERVPQKTPADCEVDCLLIRLASK